ncbi:early nodulin-like protein 18 [Bidens hawaiensis]|uniref:early nodulin-like protein 18 n=1 Tax=Bidens hawaiensis TaxID=980011 RepID=UPI00404B431E
MTVHEQVHFLNVFNTNSNQTVILTYNETTFHSCSIDNSSDSDTFVYTQGNVIGQPLTVAVPLTIEGPNYFFSDANDGIQCKNGLAFGINVTHGVGLPPNLNQPPLPPYVDPPSNADGSDTTTVTNQPSGTGLSGSDNVQRVVYYALMSCGLFGLFF